MTEQITHPESGELQDFIEGSLDKSSAAVLESHVLGCARCQKEITELRSVFSALARIERFSPGLGFANRVMAQVKLPEPSIAFAQALERLGCRYHRLMRTG